MPIIEILEFTDDLVTVALRLQAVLLPRNRRS